MGKVYSMTLKYLDSKRISGTTADREGIPAVSGGWKELARTTLGGAADIINVGSLSDKRYYMTLTSCLASGTINAAHQLNSDTGTNYASRYNVNGGSDATIPNASFMGGSNVAYATPQFLVSYYANISTKEKLFQTHNVFQNTAGAGTAPARGEAVGKHAQTTNPISAINAVNNDSGDFNTGSEVVVLGWDDSDTHTTNFWEELGSADLSGGTADLLNITSFTAKKYLWIQYYIEESTANANARLTFNNDTGSNYAYRRSLNGGTDSTGISKAYISPDGFEAGNKLVNIFIINNSANEKLVTSNSITNATAGAGTAPTRCEMAFKWTNTSSQITRIDLTNTDSGEMGTGSILKVWGSN